MEHAAQYNDKGQINIVLKKSGEKIKKEEKQHHTEDNPFVAVDEAFSSFIGINHLQETVKEIYASLIINKKRIEVGLKPSKQSLHMLFRGNPGTGKTTVARKLAELFHQLEVLSKGHLIEAERADLVGEYIGHTAQKTRELVQKALGGILFIDEAYSLGRGGEKDFGKEAIDTLVKQMEDYHHDFVLILAGYPKEMDNFLKLNPGLRSRFPFHMEFKDYTVDELLQIAFQMVKEREYILSKEAEWKLRDIIMSEKQSNRVSFSNGRFIRNVLEEAIRKQAMRNMYQQGFRRKELMTLTSHDFEW
ncbi:AAA family ATPase [Bacillaceae bacterium S4-13-58]